MEKKDLEYKLVRREIYKGKTVYPNSDSLEDYGISGEGYTLLPQIDIITSMLPEMPRDEQNEKCGYFLINRSGNRIGLIVHASATIPRSEQVIVELAKKVIEGKLDSDDPIIADSARICGESFYPTEADLNDLNSYYYKFREAFLTHKRSIESENQKKEIATWQR